MVHYGMTKTAQIAVARGVAESIAGTNVTANSVLVGPTASEGVGDFVQSMALKQGVSKEQVEKEFFDKARPSSLLKRFETTEEIAAVVAFVASTQSAGIIAAGGEILTAGFFLAPFAGGAAIALADDGATHRVRVVLG